MPIFVTFDMTGEQRLLMVPRGNQDKEYQDYYSNSVLSTIERDGPKCGSGPVLISHQYRQPDEHSYVGTLYYPVNNPVYVRNNGYGVRFVTSYSWDNTDDRGIRSVGKVFHDGLYVYQIYLTVWPGSTCSIDATRAYGVYRKGTSAYRDREIWQTYYSWLQYGYRYGNYNVDYLLSKIFDPSWWDWSKGGSSPASGSGLFHCEGFYTRDADIPSITFSSQFTPLDRGEWVCWASHCWDMPYYSDPSMIRNKGFGIAFYDALDKLPVAGQNMIANILDIVSTIKSFREGFTGVADSLSDLAKDAWLSYRYVYNTTKADIEEVAELSQRLVALSNVRVVKSYGSYSDDLADYNCVIEIDPWYFFPKDLLGKLHQYGLDLSLANAWDMVPYSFVVDWFFDVSSALEAIDKWLTVDQIPIKAIWYSFHTNYDDGSNCYGRFLGNRPTWPYAVPKQTSAKACWMRVADSIALFT